MITELCDIPYCMFDGGCYEIGKL